MNLQLAQEIVKRVEFFHGLTAEDVMKIFAKGTTQRVNRGDVIFYKGTVGNQMYIILNGCVGIFDGDKLLAELRTGDMFGEMALVSHDPRTATAKALEDSLFFVLSETTFEHLLTKRAAVQILLNIVRTMGRRLKETNRKLMMG
jgi:CRP-like cAMP-binding protein